MDRVRVPLYPEVFGAGESDLIDAGPLSATAFRFESGVPAVRLSNEQGSLVILPYQGQQIWSMWFGGRELAMRSMFTQPMATRSYLETYGAMLIHCGATAMGVPTGADTHPLHGELPNAPYRSAWVEVGEDGRGLFISLGGEYQHTVAFSTNYVARPQVRLYAGATLVQTSMSIENLKRTPMELMYLAHANFRPVDNGRLVYSAQCAPETVRVRTSVPGHVRTSPQYPAFLAELAAHPERHNVLTPGLAFDPEVEFFIDYLADADGWAHTLQMHPDGSADLISHRPDQLDHGVRWICRTPDQDALGMCLPATAEPEGYHAELAKGNVRTLPAGGTVRFDMVIGYLAPEEALARQQDIERILDAAI